MQNYELNRRRKQGRKDDWFEFSRKPPKETAVNFGWMDRCKFESNCPLVGPGTIGGMPSVGVILKDVNPYLHEFWRKLREKNW